MSSLLANKLHHAGSMENKTVNVNQMHRASAPRGLKISVACTKSVWNKSLS